MLLLWFVVMIMFMPIVVAIISIIILASSARIVAAVSYGMINQVCNDFYFVIALWCLRCQNQNALVKS